MKTPVSISARHLAAIVTYALICHVAPVTSSAQFVLTDDLVIDDASATFSGAAWAASANTTNAVAGSQRQRGSGAAASTLILSATLPADGFYRVYFWVPTPQGGATASTAVPVTINWFDFSTSTTISKVVTINETVNVGSWVSLGAYPFSASVAATVTVPNSGSGTTLVDAVRFVEATPDTVLEENATGTVTYSGGTVAPVVKTGTWANWTAVNANAGAAVRQLNSAAGNSVRFTPNLTVPGEYDVFIYWPENAAHQPTVKVRTIHAGSASAASPDERTLTVQGVSAIANKGAWRYVATYRFKTTATATLPGSVYIYADGSNAAKYLVADAVRFAKTGAQHLQDNTDPLSSSRPNVAYNGTIWTSVSAATFDGRFGRNWTSATAPGTNAFTYSPLFTFPAGGGGVVNYDVYAWWPTVTGLTTSATYTVQTSTTSVTVTKSQAANGGKWNWLGNWPLDPATAILKINRTTGATGTVAADAVYFLRDPDSDQDGLDDAWEWQFATALATFTATNDPDNDGRSNQMELQENTSPNNPAPTITLLSPMSAQVLP